jgi:hypothetical protein
MASTGSPGRTKSEVTPLARSALVEDRGGGVQLGVLDGGAVVVPVVAEGGGLTELVGDRGELVEDRVAEGGGLRVAGELGLPVDLGEVAVGVVVELGLVAEGGTRLLSLARCLIGLLV